MDTTHAAAVVQHTHAPQRCGLNLTDKPLQAVLEGSGRTHVLGRWRTRSPRMRKSTDSVLATEKWTSFNPVINEGDVMGNC